MDNLSTPYNTSHYTSSSASTNPSETTPNHHQQQQQQQQFWVMNNTNMYNQSHHTFNLNNEETEEEETKEEQEVENSKKEAMFEKPLTPSDVGKLNRLVIPKQHAEKYFPLGGGGVGSESGADKGLLLSFEDEAGKPWRFRYSYWNSSQSYVLTKGWSRYVKDKRLHAGDVVLFQRHRTDADRLFIAWRRRSDGPSPAHVSSRGVLYSAPLGYSAHHHHTGVFNTNNNNTIGAAPVVPYQPDSIHAGLVSVPAHQNQTTSVGNNNNSNSNSSKILRLFGVNLECHDQDQCEPSTPDNASSLSTQDHQTYHHFYHPHQHNHMDFTFSRDVKAMRDRRG